MRYFELLGETNFFKGRVAEGYVRELMRAFDGREVDGDMHFSVAGEVRLPAFAEVRLRGGTRCPELVEGMRDGQPVEIDVLGESLPPSGGGGGSGWWR